MQANIRKALMRHGANSPRALPPWLVAESMTGLEILGAAASAVQLAVTCYNIQNRIRRINSDRELVKTVQSECTELIARIGGIESRLNPEARPDIHNLKTRLVGIKSRITRTRNSKNLVIRGIHCVRLQGSSYKDELVTALQEYQTRAAIHGNIVIEQVLSRLSKDGITQEIEADLRPIREGLTTLGELSLQAKEALATTTEMISVVDNNVRDVLATLEEIKLNAQANPVLNMEDIRRVMRTEFNALRSPLPVLQTIEERARVSPSEQQVQTMSMQEYVEKIKMEGGHLSDLEIVECLSDVVEAYKLFGVKVILPYHIRAELRYQRDKSLPPGLRRRREEFSVQLSMNYFSKSDQDSDEEPRVGIWTCLGITLI